MYNVQENLRNLKSNPDFAYMVYEDGKGDLHVPGEKKECKLIKNLKFYFNRKFNTQVTPVYYMPSCEYVYCTFDENGGHTHTPDEISYRR